MSDGIEKDEKTVSKKERNENIENRRNEIVYNRQKIWRYL